VLKLHGDFQSSRLKNTAEELRVQDSKMRRLLVDSCKRFGLAVMGYSGRDESVMQALREAIDNGRGYPFGLFWFHRPDSPLLPAAEELIRDAVKAGIQATIIEAYTFDEVAGDAVRQIENIPADVQSLLDAGSSRITDVPISAPDGGWPVIRLNALPVTSFPTLSRLIECEIGATKEVKEALVTYPFEAVATRKKAGVIAFGADSVLRKVFERFSISRLDTYAIEPKKLHYESAELGLLRDAICIALTKHRPLTVKRRRGSDQCIVDAARGEQDPGIGELKRVAGQIFGVVPKTAIKWSEALNVKLSYQLGRMWLLIEPTVALQMPEEISDDARDAAKDFVRERLASRYNRTWNALLDAWSSVIVGPGEEARVKAFSVDDGADATFTIGRTTGFSRRGRQS